MNTASLTPAYGRKYTNQQQVKKDLSANLDFIIQNITDPWAGKPANRSDLLRAGYTHAKIHYGPSLTKVIVVAL